LFGLKELGASKQDDRSALERPGPCDLGRDADLRKFASSSPESAIGNVRGSVSRSIDESSAARSRPKHNLCVAHRPLSVSDSNPSASVGTANLIELAGNATSAVTLQIIGEVLALARKRGIDSELLMAILTGAAGSRSPTTSSRSDNVAGVSAQGNYAAIRTGRCS
jgi:hypothetical protein